MTVSVLAEPAFRCEPDFFRTLGDEVADLSDLAGFAPDPEQRLGLDLIFAFDRHGKSCAFEFCVVCCRQNLKTGLFKQAALGWLFITEQRLVVWSAHEFNTAQEAHRDMATLIENTPFLSRRLKRVYNGAAVAALMRVFALTMDRALEGVAVAADPLDELRLRRDRLRSG